MKYILVLLLVAFSVGFCGCEQVEIENYIDTAHSESKEKALQSEEASIALVQEFKNFLCDEKTKSFNTNLSDFVIDKYTKSRYSYTFDDVATKSNGIQMPDSANIDLYLISFYDEKGPGFSIVTADERINKVYVYSSGNISDTATISPLAHIVKSIPALVKKDLISYYQDPSSVQPRALLTRVGPLVTTHWDQEYPYNSQCPIFNNITNPYLKGRAPAGCSTIATAQVVTYYKKFTSSVFNNGKRYVYNFPALRAQGRIDKNNASLVFEVGQLCHEIGQGIGVSWHADKGDLSDPRKIGNYLRDRQNYSIEIWNDKNVDIYKMANNIRLGNPHITSGMRKKPRTGHVWIWDGIIKSSTGSEIELVHCNWGWGKSNDRVDNTGVIIRNTDTWFTPAAMEQPDENQQAYFDDNVQIYITNYTPSNPAPPEGI